MATVTPRCDWAGCKQPGLLRAGGWDFCRPHHYEHLRLDAEDRMRHILDETYPQRSRK